MSLMPTCYFQWVRRDTAAPTMVLQQWWTNWAAREIHIPPEKCSGGKWVDVPVVEPAAIVKRSKSSDDDL